MPEIRHYIVRQTREVKVTANNPEAAARIATAGFENGQNSDSGVINGPVGVWGNTRSRVRQIALEVEEDR